MGLKAVQTLKYLEVMKERGKQFFTSAISNNKSESGWYLWCSIHLS